jgi:hypothetical protein
MAGFQDRFTSGASHMAGLEAGGGKQTMTGASPLMPLVQ